MKGCANISPCAGDGSSMGFLTPWFLAGLAAVGLPIWLHLLKQHKTTPLPFSSLMFFERRTQSSIKHRRLRYLLLFALRTALVALLALAFARPFVNSATVASARGGKLLVLAIDDSFSMRQDGRLERAKSEAAGLLSSLRPEDRGSYAELARVLRSLAQSANMPVEAHLFSDMQKSSMPPGFADLALGQGIHLVTQPVANQSLANFTVESVTAPRRLYDPKKVRIQATVMAS